MNFYSIFFLFILIFGFYVTDKFIGLNGRMIGARENNEDNLYKELKGKRRKYLIASIVVDAIIVISFLIYVLTPYF